jgi:hypothetical protein
MVLCFIPLILFVFLAIFFPKFIYLSTFGLLICPISMGVMMLFMDKKNNCSHNKTKVVVNEIEKSQN